MGFFEGAYDFEITGGTFYEIRGNQNVYMNDMSTNVNGEGNTTDIHHNRSTQYDRVFANTNVNPQAHPQPQQPPQANGAQYMNFNQVPPNVAERLNAAMYAQQQQMQPGYPYQRWPAHPQTTFYNQPYFAQHANYYYHTHPGQSQHPQPPFTVPNSNQAHPPNPSGAWQPEEVEEDEVEELAEELEHQHIGNVSEARRRPATSRRDS